MCPFVDTGVSRAMRAVHVLECGFPLPAVCAVAMCTYVQFVLLMAVSCGDSGLPFPAPAQRVGTVGCLIFIAVGTYSERFQEAVGHMG